MSDNTYGNGAHWIEEKRRLQLADFLKRRRAQLRPEHVGLSGGKRRRTPGLRREEVAELADIGSSWYTWIEQGRPITPSQDVIDRLAQALKLNQDEYAYFSRLARPAANDAFRSPFADAVPVQLTALLKSIEKRSAYIRNHRWDLLAWNGAYARIFGDFSEVPLAQRNILRLLFTDSGFCKVMPRWEYASENVVARFRSDLTKMPMDTVTVALIAELTVASPIFARMWEEHRTKEISTHPLDLALPGFGQATVERVTMEPDAAVGLKLIVHIPTDIFSERKIVDFLSQRNAATAAS